jgi:hypothetical protein
VTGRDDPMGKRALFSAGDAEAPRRSDPFAPPPPEGRRALFSDEPEPGTNPSAATGAIAAVTCRRCGVSTPLGPLGLARALVPSVWVPGRTWSRYLRCPACGRLGWCRLNFRAGSRSPSG